MKDITPTEIDKIIGIIQHSPLLNIGHFSDKGEVLTFKLSDFCQSNNYEYEIGCTTKKYFEQIEDKYKLIEGCRVRDFHLDRKSYMFYGKFYDYIFVSCDVPESEQELFFQKSYRAIKNAGLILIFIRKNQRKQISVWSELLEKNYFVATNTIELDENWSVIISKKMHGWGG